MATVRDISNEALREIGVLAAGEVATAAELNDSLVALNELVDQWAAESLEIYQTTRTVWTIVSGTQDYTLGLGGTINVERPVFLDHINFQNNAQIPPIEYQMSPLTDDAWARVPIKQITSPMPTSWYHNPTYPLATISLWPVPTLATLSGVLYAPQAVSQFTDLNTTVSLPPGYRRMLVKNLALTLANTYERDPRPGLADAARESKATVKRANIRIMDMQVEAAALVQGQTKRFIWNIMTGP